MNRCILLPAVFAVVVAVAQGISLPCYTCTEIGDGTCLDDPRHFSGKNGITNCTNIECCVILRVESTEKQGNLESFSRYCLDNCPADDVIEYPEGTFTSYCSSSLCNSGDGTIGEDGGFGGGEEESYIKFIKGKTNGGSSITTTSLMKMWLPIIGIVTYTMRF